MDKVKQKTMPDTKLNTGDAPLIARELDISKEQVIKLANGDRGKRGTENQKIVMEAINLRKRQNEQLINYCRQLKVGLIVPEPLH